MQNESDSTVGQMTIEQLAQLVNSILLANLESLLTESLLVAPRKVSSINMVVIQRDGSGLEISYPCPPVIAEVLGRLAMLCISMEAMGHAPIDRPYKRGPGSEPSAN